MGSLHFPGRARMHHRRMRKVPDAHNADSPRNCLQDQPCLYGVRQSSQPPRSAAPSQQGTDRSRASHLIPRACSFNARGVFGQRQLGTSPPRMLLYPRGVFPEDFCSIPPSPFSQDEGCIRRGASERRSTLAARPRHAVRANRSYSTTFIQPISKGDYQ